MIQADWDFMSHGIYNTRYLNPYTEEQERAFYQDCIATLKRHTGKQLKGMLGPAISGTERTPDLMAEAGLIYTTRTDARLPARAHSGAIRHAHLRTLFGGTQPMPPPSDSTTKGTTSCACAKRNSTSCTRKVLTVGGSCAWPYTPI